jgi:hypothetical protein
MTTLYVLIVVAKVYWGFNVSMQEFSSLERCEAARQVISQTIGANFDDREKVECVLK